MLACVFACIPYGQKGNESIVPGRCLPRVEHQFCAEKGASWRVNRVGGVRSDAEYLDERRVGGDVGEEFA